MRILLDENVPLGLKSLLIGHDVETVQSKGWSGVTNGELLARTEAMFDVLILADKNLRYQQNLAQRRLALVELPTNRWPVIQRIVGEIVQAVATAQPGAYAIIDMP